MFFTEVTDEFYEFGVIAFEMPLYIKVFKFSTRSTMLSLCFCKSRSHFPFCIYVCFFCDKYFDLSLRFRGTVDTSTCHLAHHGRNQSAHQPQSLL